MQKSVRRFAMLTLVMLCANLFATNLYAASPNVTFVFDVAAPISGVAPQAKAQITFGTGVLQLELRSINLPNGTPLNVSFTQHESAEPFAALAPVTIGTITISKGQAKVNLNFNGLLTGTIDGLVISTGDGTWLLHAFPMVKA